MSAIRVSASGGLSMSAHGVIAVLVALVLTLSPLAAVAAETQITDIKQPAGTWQGWVTSQLSGTERVVMTIKDDGSYRSSTTRDGGTLTVGTCFLQGGKVRSKSSRSEGTVVISEDKGKTTLTLTPEGSFNPVTGPATVK
jgi:hypothetical protein